MFRPSRAGVSVVLTTYLAGGRNDWTNKSAPIEFAMVEVALCAGLAIIVVAIVFIAKPLLRREPKKEP